MNSKESILKAYKERLVNINRRNKVLYLNRLTRKFVDLWELTNLNVINYNHLLDSIIESIINNTERKLSLIKLNEELSQDYQRYKVLEGLFNRLKKVDQDADLIKRTSGMHVEFIGYPFIEGKINDLTIKAPLFLFPIDLVPSRKTREIILIPQKDMQIYVNKAFVFVIDRYLNILIDEKDEEKLLNFICNKNFGLNERIKEIAELLAKYIKIINELPANEIEKFSEEKYENKAFRIKNYAILGIFIQFSSAIAKDYDELMKFDDLGLIDYLFATNGIDDFEKINIDDIHEDEKYFVFEIDPSQEQSILSFVKSGIKGLVIHGPPGTGKSQTIVNLISQFVKDKKKVLMVCQKKTALDVVQKRLYAAGIKNVILIEDYERDRNYALKQMEKIIEGINSVEIKIDNLNKLCTEIDKKITELNELKSTLEKKWECGMSLAEMYSKCNKDEVVKEDLLKEILLKLTFNELNEKINKLINLLSYYKKYDRTIMKFRKSWKNLTYSEKEKLENSISILLDQRNKQAYEKYHEKKYDDITHKTLEKIKKDLKSIKKLILPDKEEIPLSKLLSLEEHIARYTQAKKLSIINFIYLILKKLNSKLRQSEKIVKTLELKYKLSYRELHNILAVYKSINPKLVEDFPEVLSSRTIKEYLNNKNKEIQKLEQYIQAKNTFFKYFRLNRIPSINKLKKIQIYLNKFDDIKYYDALKEELSNEELILLNFLYKYNSKVIFNSYYYFWIDRIEANQDIFRIIKRIDHYENIKNELLHLYTQKLLEVRKYIKYLLQDIDISLEAERKIPYEANKKRKRKPLKEVINSYLVDILNLIPIWLTTPDVVSAIFPLKKGLFDIVIFDEASQMPVEYALPSLYRAKRTIIAGDEKQLPPTDFFKMSFIEEDEEEIEELEVKSLLELCKTRCPTVLLSYHYRSSYEELINFSNYAFYRRKIAISPNKKTDRPFEFIKVNGIWNDRKNYEEAKKVVEIVYKLLEQDSNKSIGIITFNSEQRDLIYDMLDKKALENEKFRELYEKSLNLTKDGEDIGLFVRNIENVQGDERDIIIFSIGYAKDQNGILRYYFGPLNKTGGENRLNVAITRAKEKVIIITSIEPEMLNVEKTKNEGPKLLKKYLQYVKAIANNDMVSAQNILNSLYDIETEERVQFDSPFEEDVYKELRKRGYKVDTQVGCSRYRIDLAIKHPQENRYILGIECDGATYHSLKSAKERDLYRQRFLEMKGWKIVRIWSRNWWRDKQKEIEKIEMTINSLS